MFSCKTRVCILLPSHWTPSIGGAEMQARLLVERLLALGSFDVHYLARRMDPTHIAQGYIIDPIPAYPALSRSFALDVPGLLRLLDRLQPDVIYQRVACGYTGAATYFARRNRKRMIWHVSSDRDLLPASGKSSWRSPIEQINKRMIAYGARHADTVVVQNAQQLEFLERYHGRSDGVLIPNFHPIPAEVPPKATDRTTVCWIGNIKDLKQPEIFLRLASDFRERADVEFILAGAQQMTGERWRRLASDMQRLPNFRYIGPQPHERIEELLARAHVLVNTSTVEGFPNTFIQAWLRSAAVLSLTVNPDGVFNNDRYGICAHGSYERLRAGLDGFLHDPESRIRICSPAAAFARERFSARNVDRIVELLIPPAWGGVLSETARQVPTIRHGNCQR